MSYLAKLKLLEGEKNSLYTPDTVPTKPTEPPFGSFGSTHPAHIEKKIIDVMQDTVDINISKNCDVHSAGTSWRWLLHYPEHDVEVTTTPESTLSELLRDFPGAISADPVAEVVQK